MDRVLGPVAVRTAERRMEARYPLHRQLRWAASRYFQDNGWDVVPHGVGVWRAKKVLADLAIAKGSRIVLVECLTPDWVFHGNAKKKRRLEQFFPLWFVIADPAAHGERTYKKRVERLARNSKVFLWSKGRTLTRHTSKPG